MKDKSIPQLLENRSLQFPGASAILGLYGRPLKFSDLWVQVQETVERLHALGIRRNDRVAIVLPNGPEMAVAFLSIASGASCAPLNPSYQATEFEFYLSDLDARALVVLADQDSPAIPVARSLGIPILQLVPSLGGPAGSFTLSGERLTRTGATGFAEIDDIALVLHTSGTTAEPKMVPLSHHNLCVSAANIKRSLKLTPRDRCLNIMPLFHIHGLMAALMASLAAGGSVVCTPGHYAPDFFKWLDLYEPTWYTAVPTMHQSILSRVADNRSLIGQLPLRFIRSCSSSLPPRVMAELERIFKVPVVEAYGMTEASHQMSCNPLPPALRKPGSVGVPTGPEMAIMSEQGERLLSAGETGEIVIRGANVTTGYHHNPNANAAAFTDGWFRTGDSGFVDPDGYFFITGRIKEQINCGGEKISPREIEEILLDHPHVQQAVVFAMPDDRLGEKVAAAVVQKEPKIEEAALRRYAASRLVHFKVPQRILILNDIPKGPTGKLQRVGLAKKLGLTKETESINRDRAPFVEPRTPVEEYITIIWSEILQDSHVGVHDRFLDLDGDSLMATRILNRINQYLDVDLSMMDLFDAPTIAQLAQCVEKQLSERND